MKPKAITLDVADEDTDGLADGVTATAGTAFTLITDTPTDGLAHKIVITPSGSVTGSYTISGTYAGRSVTETLATDTTNAVTSVYYYDSDIVVLAPSGLGAETVDIGWADEVASQPIPLDWRMKNFKVGLDVNVTGTVNYTVQHCMTDIYNIGVTGDNWAAHDSLVTKTADAMDNYVIPVRATRLVFNSYSSGAEATFNIVQEG